MHINNGVQPTRHNHIHNIRNSLQPRWINSPIWRASRKMISPCNRDADTSEASSLHSVKCRCHDSSIVPRPLVRNSIERVSEIPSGMKTGNEV
jgi:CCR4-NOT transcriptional regulation complex NOT5 subunit